MNQMVELIILTGTPGTGKSTLMEILREELKYPVFNINQVIIENELFDRRDEERDTLILNEEKIEKYFIKFIDSLPNDAKVIVNGHYFEFIHRQFISMIIILRTHPEALLDRLEKRKYKVSKIQENVQAEILGNIMGVILEKYSSIPLFQVDTSIMNVEESKKLILKFINKEIPPTKIAEYIDWLPILEEKNELEKYFSRF